MEYVPPNQQGSKVSFRSRYGNFIGGDWKEPVKGQYFEDITPVTGRAFCEVARSTAEDIDLALDAAHKAKRAWGATAPAERAVILNKIADRLEQNLEILAVAECWENGKPVRETLAADLPLAIDQAREVAEDRERHALRPGRRGLDAQLQSRIPRRARAQGRTRLDQLLSPVPGTRCLRRLQAIRHRP
jgi:acyl-CoA reductase-like NAD-dependent aldehyde dehydrogenase